MIGCDTMSESQKIINKILHDIIHNEEEIVEDFYGILVFVYKDIDKYLNQVDDIKDKIFIAQ